jgi:uncharacterized protein (DUF697 family)
MATQLKERAGVIIHSCSAASALLVGTVATVPVFGPLGIIFGLDYPALTAISIGMVVSLGKLFGRNYTTGAVMAAVTQLTGFVFGVSLMRGVVGIVPVVGAAINAGLVFTVTEILGWTTFLIFEEGRDITKMNKSKLKSYVKKGKKRAEQERLTREALFAKLPPHVKAQYDYLTKKLANEKATDQERQVILNEIDQLLAPYKELSHT